MELGVDFEEINLIFEEGRLKGIERSDLKFFSRFSDGGVWWQCGDQWRRAIEI